MSELEHQMTLHLPDLRRYAQALERDPDRADDLVQDCFERALRKRHLWRGTGNLRRWLFRVMHSLCMNERRARGRRRVALAEHAIAAAASSPAFLPPERMAEWLEIAVSIERLPDAQRAAITAVAFGSGSYADAAARLGVPVGTVRSRLARAREALRASAPGARTTNPSGA